MCSLDDLWGQCTSSVWRWFGPRRDVWGASTEREVEGWAHLRPRWLLGSWVEWRSNCLWFYSRVPPSWLLSSANASSSSSSPFPNVCCCPNEAARLASPVIYKRVLNNWKIKVQKYRLTNLDVDLGLDTLWNGLLVNALNDLGNSAAAFALPFNSSFLFIGQKELCKNL